MYLHVESDHFSAWVVFVLEFRTGRVHESLNPCNVIQPSLRISLLYPREYLAAIPMSLMETLLTHRLGTGGQSRSWGRSSLRPKSRSSRLLVSCCTAAGSLKSSCPLGLRLPDGGQTALRRVKGQVQRAGTYYWRKAAEEVARWAKSISTA